MDYEEKYKQALERARDYYKANLKLDKADENLVLEDIFPELAESEDERIRKSLINFFDNANKCGENPMYEYGIYPEEILAWLEKQGEKPQGKSALEAINEEKVDNANKVEPKFKVGDWIVDNQGLVHQIERVVENITTHTFGYDIVGGGYFNDKSEVRLWTIADAKNGDVLYLQHDGKEHIIIYKGVIKERFRTFVSAYCAYNGIVDAFCFADVSRYADIAYGGVMPATKEQRDLLFQKMHEAGYEWNAEKKELRNSNEFNCGGNPQEIQ